MFLTHPDYFTLCDKLRQFTLFGSPLFVKAVFKFTGSLSVDDFGVSFPVGNKDDCPDLKLVEREDAQKFAEQMGVELFETSAKENQNIEEVCLEYFFY